MYTIGVLDFGFVLIQIFFFIFFNDDHTSLNHTLFITFLFNINFHF